MKKTIIIYADDDLEQLNDLRRAISVAERKAAEAALSATRYGDGTSDEDETVEAAREALEKFIDEAAERAEAWTVANIGHEEFRELLAACPARRVESEEPSEGDPKTVTHPDDAQFGVDTTKFPKELLLYVDREDSDHRTILEPTENVARKLKRLSEGQFNTLWITAYGLNVGGVVDPKAMLYSTAPTFGEI